MSFLRVRYLQVGLAVAATVLLGAVCDWGELSAVIAGLTLTDVLLGALGLAVAAMTGASGVLIAADVRADVAAAQAWHEIHAKAAAIATPAETASTDRVDALYMARPQDEGLRRILLAHRFMVPLLPPDDIGSLAPECSDASAVPAAVSIKPGHHAVLTVAAADGLGEQLAAAQRKLGPVLISSKATSALGRTRNNAIRKAFASKRVANAGSRWDWPAFTTAVTSRMSGSDFGCNEIVLTDRNGRDENSASGDVAPERETTVQSCCRGPPRSTFRRHIAGGPAPSGKAFRETDRPRANPPADLVVIDNLGDRVPVCEAELEVLEAYLADVLRDVLGGSETEPDSKAK